MPEHALKEWAVVIAALSAGEQVLILRKGGIGEKRFELPHPRFFLFPTHEHQRPELIRPEHRERHAAALGRREEPARLPLTAWAEVDSAHPIADPQALAALEPLHILSPDYAEERLRWRRKHPLWAVVLRVWLLEEPPVLDVLPEHGGCVSWVALPPGISPGRMRPALPEDEFRSAAGEVAAALAAAGVA